MGSYKDLGYNSYDEYLQSKHWQKLRERFVNDKNARCKICKKRGGLVLHHRTYLRLGNERAGDTIVLCRACNTKVHFYESGERVPLTHHALYKREKEIGSFWYKLKQKRPSDFFTLIGKLYGI